MITHCSWMSTAVIGLIAKTAPFAHLTTGSTAIPLSSSSLPFRIRRCATQANPTLPSAHWPHSGNRITPQPRNTSILTSVFLLPFVHSQSWPRQTSPRAAYQCLTYLASATNPSRTLSRRSRRDQVGSVIWYVVPIFKVLFVVS